MEVCDSTAVSVDTICADYFMEVPLHAMDESVAAESRETLTNLLKASSELGVTDIVIPCVDKSSLDNKETVDRFANQIRIVLPDAERQKINLSLETNLSQHNTMGYTLGCSPFLLCLPNGSKIR